jgi:hypothetical protein
MVDGLKKRRLRIAHKRPSAIRLCGLFVGGETAVV